MTDFDNNSLITLRNSLPKGYASRIRSRLKERFSVSYITKVLNGKRFNIEIIEAAIAISEKERKTIDSIKNRLVVLSNN